MNRETDREREGAFSIGVISTVSIFIVYSWSEISFMEIFFNVLFATIAIFLIILIWDVFDQLALPVRISLVAWVIAIAYSLVNLCCLGEFNAYNKRTLLQFLATSFFIFWSYIEVQVFQDLFLVIDIFFQDLADKKREKKKK